MDELEESDEVDLSLLETLDHALNRGLVIAGEITISVADVDLIFLGLNLVVGAADTVRGAGRGPKPRLKGPQSESQ
ncbi:MAG TPA: gas vesicle protein [Blastocatellia bacterium]|nr:gas vesicle protein [Blastocatellia bacterium]